MKKLEDNDRREGDAKKREKKSVEREWRRDRGIGEG